MVLSDLQSKDEIEKRNQIVNGEKDSKNEKTEAEEEPERRITKRNQGISGRGLWRGHKMKNNIPILTVTRF